MDERAARLQQTDQLRHKLGLLHEEGHHVVVAGAGLEQYVERQQAHARQLPPPLQAPKAPRDAQARQQREPAGRAATVALRLPPLQWSGLPIRTCESPPSVNRHAAAPDVRQYAYAYLHRGQAALPIKCMPVYTMHRNQHAGPASK